MTSDGSYPPGYEPNDGGAPYGRYPADEQDGRGHPSGTARAVPGAWGSPPDAQYAPPDAQYAQPDAQYAPPTDRFAPPDRYGQGGGDWPAQAGYPPAGYGPTGSGPDPAQGRPAGYPSQASYGIERPATANYAAMGSDRPGQPGWQPEPPAAQGGGWQPDASQQGYGGQGGGYGSPSVPRPPEPARAPEQGWPADPGRPGGAPPAGRAAGSASVGGQPMGASPVSGPGGGPAGRGSASGVYGTPTQYGSPSQYGSPTQYGEPGQFGGAGGRQQFGNAGQFGATQVGTPGQLGGGQYGGPGQYGGNQSGPYSSGQYGTEPAGSRFGPDADAAPPRKSRRGLIIGLAVAGVVIIALAAVALVVSMSGNKASDYAVGSCVKQSGDKASAASCSDAGAYSVVTKTDSPSKCVDQTQPYVVLQRSGSSDEVLCLKPAR